ncbi:3-oxoacyl-[acyl-carrier protein] reductase [Myxococcaceae bacterium]|jgi:3-oxoacyl-[acyl-carrier protein] reductase|nr:3-oxoacyl-[acyl-carrier protein] reductase [Myxococcaceae bacterium]
MDVRGKAALVTGGATGVGRATALELARLGCDVAVNYSRSAKEADETVDLVRAAGARSVAVRADVANDADCRRLVATSVDELGRLDVLVQSAGVTTFIAHADLDRVGDDDWDRLLGVNLKGAFQCARAARGPMLAAGGGAIVNVSSVAGVAGIGSSIPYCASKAALNNLTLTLARALAPKIRVNAVAPGFITGRWLQGGLGAGYEPIKKAMEQRAPLGRVCEPEDVARAILGFVTGSDLVTGQVLVVDGGLLIAG